MFLRAISWGRAFTYALEYFAFILLWTIAGGVLIFIGFSIIGLTLLTSSVRTIFGSTNSIEAIPLIDPRIGFVAGAILIIVGYLVMALGYSATFFKILSKLIVETMSS